MVNNQTYPQYYPTYPNYQQYQQPVMQQPVVQPQPQN